MSLIECRAVPEDAYPAGLRLACDLWTEAKRADDSPLSFSAIEAFWDGVKLIGEMERRSFEIEINYASEEIVLLEVEPVRRSARGRRRVERLEAVGLAVRALLERMEGRPPVRLREPGPRGPRGSRAAGPGSR